MKIRLKQLIYITAVMVTIFSCNSNSGSKDANLLPNAHKVKAEEVIQGTRYTYVRVSSEGNDYWIAINKVEVKEGDTYYWSEGTEMNNFTSKELQRTFPSIFFVMDFTDQPITAASSQKQMTTSPMAGKVQAPEYKDIVVPKAPGGITIGELYGKKESYNGKSARICGKVVKYSAGIMNRNWVHIQDGTRAGDKFDLAITTLDSVKVGDVVIFEGVIALNKDVGAGYFYDVIMENAVVKK